MGTEAKYLPPNDPPYYSYDNPQIAQPTPTQMPSAMHVPGQAPMQPYTTAVQSGSSTTNVIVVNQPPMLQDKLILGHVEGHRDWSSDLCACMSDTGGCLWTVCCTACVLADISAKLRENVCVTCCVPGGTITLRTRLRTLGGIQGSICNDCCTMGCCYWCALCQMSRELTVMGL